MQVTYGRIEAGDLDGVEQFQTNYGVRQREQGDVLPVLPIQHPGEGISHRVSSAVPA